MDEVKKYVCTSEDLDKLLPDGRDDLPDLKKQFRDLFSSNWRLNYKGTTPSDVFAQFGIDYGNPTVRDAVAFDLVKLDDDSVSNDRVYTYDERKNYSPMEYERYLLNKNFRINLVNLEPDWSNISYKDDEGNEPKKKRTILKVFQGIRISKTLLEYFKKVMDKGSVSDDIYVPFTNANDFSAEVALIPNTHPDFRPITSKAYYDTKWAQYKSLLKEYGITAISTFALVDPKKDKNHTGEYLVKIQSGSNGNWKYLVVKMNKDGQIVSEPEVWTSSVNSILCVCEDDFYRDKSREAQRSLKRDATDTWTPDERDIPMVHSTTSSHYSIFRQRIPDYDLKLVRHYLQFKNRLQGMELCLEQVRRDVHHKEVRSAECFTKLTMVIKRLMDEFASNKELMDLVKQYYDLLSEWDKLTMKKVQIGEVKDVKLALLGKLQDEYNSLGNNQLDKKLALGQKIASLKLELDKSIEQSLKAIEERLGQIVDEMNAVNTAIETLQNKGDFKISREDASRIKRELGSSEVGELQEQVQEATDEMKEKYSLGESDETSGRDGTIQVKDVETKNTGASSKNHRRDEQVPPPLQALKTDKLHRLILQSERWRNYSFNIGYELSQFKQMLTKCEDATIKVRRLLHNFEERMKDTQEQVWDENYNLRTDFDFKDISVAGLRDVILLHDWWAANAPGAKPEDMGMTDEEFMLFRRRCNKVSYNLRKNQYAQLLSVRIDRTQRRISELDDIIKDKDTLHWEDKYGWEAKKDDGEEAWTVEKANAKARERIRLIAESVVKEEATYRECARMEKQYKEDAKKLVERTMDYLKHLGLVDNESDLERLATTNLASKNPELSQRWLSEIQNQREELDSKTELMKSQRQSLQSILDNVAKMETEIKELQARNKRIYATCTRKRNAKGIERAARDRMLMDKIGNEQRIMELKSLVKKAKTKHLDDFTALEKMRKEVDDSQEMYNEKVGRFKKEIGLTKEAMDNFMVGIYNKFQDEILEHDNKR